MCQEGEEDEMAKKYLKVCKYLKYFQFSEVLHCTFPPRDSCCSYEGDLYPADGGQIAKLWSTDNGTQVMMI